MQAPVQSRLPSLEDLTCGNTAGVRPKAITRAQLMTAQPLQQVHSSLCDGFTLSCSLLAKVPLEKHSGGPALNSRWLEERRGETIQSGQTSGQGVSHCAHRAEV